MATTLHEIFGTDTNTGLVKQVVGGVPNDLPPALMTLTKPVEGNTGKYSIIDDTRRNAPITGHKSPSRTMQQKERKQREFTCLSPRINHIYDDDILDRLESFDNPGRQEMGIEEVSHQTRILATYLKNTRTSAWASALSRGAISYNKQGDIQPGSSTYNIDYEIPAGHKNQCNVFGSGNIFTATWNTVGTDIPQHITGLKNAAVRETGYPLTWALYGKNVLSYLLKNNMAANIVRGTAAATVFASNQIPNGFLGLNWLNASDHFFEDENGNIQDWFGDDDIVFMPEPDIGWIYTAEGTSTVPKNNDISANAVSALGRSVQKVRGAFGYAKITDDPCAVTQIMGDTFLPIIAVPKNLYIATVAGF